MKGVASMLEGAASLAASVPRWFSPFAGVPEPKLAMGQPDADDNNCDSSSDDDDDDISDDDDEEAAGLAAMAAARPRSQQNKVPTRTHPMLGDDYNGAVDAAPASPGRRGKPRRRRHGHQAKRNK